MHARTEERPHLLRRHRIPSAQAVDVGHPRADPRSWSFSALGVVGGQLDMALLGGVQRRNLPRQVVVPRPGAQLVNAHRHNHPKGNGSASRSAKRVASTGDAGGVPDMAFRMRGGGYVSPDALEVMTRSTDWN